MLFEKWRSALVRVPCPFFLFCGTICRWSSWEWRYHFWPRLLNFWIKIQSSSSKHVPSTIVCLYLRDEHYAKKQCMHHRNFIVNITLHYSFLCQYLHYLPFQVCLAKIWAIGNAQDGLWEGWSKSSSYGIKCTLRVY